MIPFFSGDLIDYFQPPLLCLIAFVVIRQTTNALESATEVNNIYAAGIISIPAPAATVAFGKFQSVVGCRHILSPLGIAQHRIYGLILGLFASSERYL